MVRQVLSSVPRRLALLLSAALVLVGVPMVVQSASAGGPANVLQYDQCKTGNPALPGGVCAGWTNGILNATANAYREGEVTPQRLLVHFDDAGTHTVDLSYLTYDSGVHAYDSLATWNTTRTNADRCQDLDAALCLGGAASTLPIPLDTTTHPRGAGVGISAVVSDHQLPGQVLTLYGGTLTGAAYQGYGTYAKDYQTLRVSLTTASPGSTVMMLFGGHIAGSYGPQGWGLTDKGGTTGASGVNGGSYHVRVTNINGGAIGNRDNQLMSGAIVPPSPASVTTSATATATIGGSISDSATITPATATGSVVFRAYGPDDADCSGTPAYTSAPVTVAAGAASSPAFTPTLVGTYRWVAAFTSSAPLLFEDATGACNDAGETSVVSKTSPGLSTSATATARLLSEGDSIRDVATVTGLTSTASGNVTFTVYGPDDADCSDDAAFTSTVPLGAVSGGTATATSGWYTPTAAGTYRWRASYPGDLQNGPVSGACNATGETSTVQPATGTIDTGAEDLALDPRPADPEADLPSGTISDTAVLGGLTSGATGTVTFSVWGPQDPADDADCSGDPLATYEDVDIELVDGEWTAVSPELTVTEPGAYHWIASYSGDADNDPSAGTCGEEGETSLVTQPVPGLDKTADRAEGSTVAAGDTITYTVTVSNTGTGPIEDAVVTDTLPATAFTVDEDSISDGGTYDAATRTITWTLDLAAGDEVDLTYSGTVGTVSAATDLVNTAEFLDLSDETLHVARPGGLSIAKSVSAPQVVTVGSTLTYSLVVKAAGQLTEPDVVVTDAVPGKDPARPGSGKTTYVPGSAACDAAGPCTAAYDAATGVVTWQLGDLAAGDSRTVTFAVTVDPPATAGAAIADILNAGAVASTRTPSVPSNEVRTPVTVVAPVTVTQPPRVLPFVEPPPRVLPFTGAWVLPTFALGLGVALLGALLVGAGRRRRSA